MKGLVLEGGGAKGAFHAGAIKAFFERGYKFEGVTGTSIGAFNAALIAQGDFELCYDFWKNLKPSTVFDANDAQLEQILKGKIWGNLKYILKTMKEFFSNRGISTDKFEEVLQTLINENKIRQSSIDYGLVTISVTDDWEPIVCFKEDIIEGQLKDYIMASAFLPVFKKKSLGDGKNYIDGGLYDNLPINPLIRKGFSDIVAIRTNSEMPHKDVLDYSVNITYVEPSEVLGRVLDVRVEIIHRYLKLGYYDAIRVIDGLYGRVFYVKPYNIEELISSIELLNADAFKIITKFLKIKSSQNKENILKRFIRYGRQCFSEFEVLSDSEAFLRILEHLADMTVMEKFNIYTIKEFLENYVLKQRKTDDTSVKSIKIFELLNLVLLKKEKVEK